MKNKIDFGICYKEGIILDKNQELVDIDTAIAYAQLAVHTLRNSATELTDKSLKSEIKMLHDKFGTSEVKRLANIIVKEKK